MRGLLLHALLVYSGLAALGSGQSREQKPNYQPGWPCTGKERSFDPSYAKLAEATGGHLMLFDKAEVSGASALAIGDMKHKDTVVRAAGKIDSYVDIPIPVDSSMESLFIAATLQCMQTIYLYDPQRSSVNPADNGGEDAWFHAGRLTTLVKPQPGQWILRLLGSGPYFVSVQARSKYHLGTVNRNGQVFSVSVDSGGATPHFRLVSAGGETLRTLPLEPVGDSPNLYEGSVDLLPMEFRITVDWITQDQEQVQRTDPRLFETEP